MSAPMRMFPRGDRNPKAEDMLNDPAAKRSTSRAWRELAWLFKRHRAHVAAGVALTLVSRFAGLVLPASSKYFIDKVLVEHRASLLLPLAAVVIAAGIIQAVTGYTLSLVLGVAAQRTVAEMRRKLASHVLRLPIETFDATQVGALTSRILNDPDGIRNLLGSGLAQLMGGLVTATAALGVLFWINWHMTTVMIFFLALIGGSVAFAFSRLRPINRERSIEFARVTGRLSEALGGIRVIKAYIAERREDIVFARGVHTMLRLVVKTLSGWALVAALTTIAVSGIGATLILIGGRAVLAGSMTVGDLVMYALFTGLVTAPLIQVAQIGTLLSDALAGLERVHDLLDEPTEETVAGQSVPQLEGNVEFDDVGFYYRAGVPVLRGISFSAAAGTTTALVGPSGSGKSTLLGLLAAFHRPRSGRILIDGFSISTFDLREYRAQIGLVLQETFLFDGTILENIRFSRPDAAIEDVHRVAKVAHCDEFIRRMPDGYDTIVGERGVKLSGGQRQRVAIARALLADPAILLLDEATSSLDSESESLIQEGLEALRSNRTTFVIAHRLSTILSADQIVVLENGSIVERGTHAALLAAGGVYARLYETQQRTIRNRFVNRGEELTEAS
jgi:ABC-type multidrug transport system fused ATPase/permease subunit